MSNRPVITIPDAAKKALADDDKLEKPTPAKPTAAQIKGQRLIAKVVNGMMRETLFGPRMQPTLRQRLLMWTSHRAIRNAWASEKKFARSWN